MVKKRNYKKTNPGSWVEGCVSMLLIALGLALMVFPVEPTLDLIEEPNPPEAERVVAFTLHRVSSVSSPSSSAKPSPAISPSSKKAVRPKQHTTAKASGASGGLEGIPLEAINTVHSRPITQGMGGANGGVAAPDKKRLSGAQEGERFKVGPMPTHAIDEDQEPTDRGNPQRHKRLRLEVPQGAPWARGTRNTVNARQRPVEHYQGGQ